MWSKLVFLVQGRTQFSRLLVPTSRRGFFRSSPARAKLLPGSIPAYDRAGKIDPSRDPAEPTSSGVESVPAIACSHRLRDWIFRVLDEAPPPCPSRGALTDNRAPRFPSFSSCRSPRVELT